MQNAMSALPPKADMCGATRDVRFVPIADIGVGLWVSVALLKISTTYQKHAQNK